MMSIFGLPEMRAFAENHEDPRVVAIWLRLEDARRKNARWCEQVKQMDEILEACWRYFDHCLRVSLPRESCDSGELMVRMTLFRDAQRMLGLIGPLPGEGG